jgi:hypothetical protein
MLFSLYESVAEVSEEQKIKVETILLSDVETINTNPQQQRPPLKTRLKNTRDR